VTSFYDAHRVPLRLFYNIMTRTHAQGIPNMPTSGGVVLACNHLSMLDPWLLGALIPRQMHFMAKEELFKFGPLGWYLRKAGSFPIRRGESDRTAIRHAESLLRDGKVVMIFPEGHRSDSAGAQAARAGAVLLAARTNSPILPVGIAGTEKLRLKRVDGTSHLALLSRPDVYVSVGAPIVVDSGGGGGARKAAAELVMRKIVALLPPSYHGIYGDDARLTV
jgi:1-acyl-sn-glycerol-3-phosphate acyltransferase